MKQILWIVIVLQLSVIGQINTVRNLVFEGAGIRGIAYSGAIKVFEEKVD